MKILSKLFNQAGFGPPSQSKLIIFLNIRKIRTKFSFFKIDASIPENNKTRAHNTS